jgi:hypothetical protein
LLGAATATGALGDVDVSAQLERDFFADAHERHGEREWSESLAAGAELSFADAIELGLSAAATR